MPHRPRVSPHWTPLTPSPSLRPLKSWLLRNGLSLGSVSARDPHSPSPYLEHCRAGTRKGTLCT